MVLGTVFGPTPGNAQSEQTQTPGGGVVEMLTEEARQSGLASELKGMAPGRGVTGPQAAADAAPARPAAAQTDGSEPSGETEAPAPPTIGERVTQAIPIFVESLFKEIIADYQALRQSTENLAGLLTLNTGRLLSLLGDLAGMALASALVYALGRTLAQPLYRQIGRSADRLHLMRTAALALGSIMIDFGIVCAAVVAGALAGQYGHTPDLGEAAVRAAYLGSFLIAGAIGVVIRAVFSPAAPQLRPFAISDHAARVWSFWLAALVVIVSFSELLLREIIRDVGSQATADATVVMIYVAVLVALTAMVLRYRRAPSEHLERRAAESDGDATYSILAWVMGYWHFAALAYLAVLFHMAVTPGRAALPLLLAATEIAAAFAVGLFLVTVLSRMSDNGIRLSSGIDRALPTLEPRLNAFVPAFLKVVRFIFLVVWLVYALQAVGAIDLWDWVRTRIGVDILGAATSVLIIVFVGFLLWLFVSSWIDFRLTPRFGRYPTARERTLLTLLRNAATVAIVLIGLTYILSQLGVSVAPLLASAGVLGLAIGFGSQKMVEDIITGIFIQFENAVNVGDYIEAGGKAGVVEKLTVRSVGLRDLHGVYHVVPFSSVAAVSNYMKGFSYHVADIRVAYREDMDLAKAEMLAAFDELRSDPERGAKIYGDLEWFGLNELGDSAVVLRARLKTAPGEQWGLGRAYTELVKRRFDAAGISIPFPHVTMWFGEEKGGGAPAAKVSLVDDKPPYKQPQRQAPAPRHTGRHAVRKDTATDGDGGADGDGPEGTR